MEQLFAQLDAACPENLFTFLANAESVAGELTPFALRIARQCSTLEELRRQLGTALEKAPRVETTGERSFAAVAEIVRDLASREMLEALVWYARSNLMEAKVCEEEIIGLRLYSGVF